MRQTASPSRIHMALTAHDARQIREGAATAAITSMLHITKSRLGNSSTACAAQPGNPIEFDESVTIAAQPMSSNPMRRTPTRSTAAMEREAERSGILPEDKSATIIAQFQPLDPGIVSDALPAFFIGRNKEGFWVARDARGRIGGIFLLENSALSFARRNSQPAGCATIFPSENIELDLENQGNPFVAPLGRFRRLATQERPAMIKRFCIAALTTLAAGAALAAIIALKAALFFWIFHYS